MALITRTAKGEKLTIAEMDGNLNYLNGSYKNIGNSSVTSTVNWSEAKTQEINLNNNPSLTFSNGVIGGSTSLLLTTLLTQRSVSWPSNVTWNRGFTPSLPVASPKGQLDLSFNAGFGFQMSGGVNCFTLSSGKILVWTPYDEYNMDGGTGLIRLNRDGSRDTTFVSNNWGGMQKNIFDILELSDGRILVAGGFDNGGNLEYYGNAYIQLLSANGERQSGFAPAVGGGMSPIINSIKQQSDGKIIIAGNFTIVNGVSHYGIARFTSLLALDDTFNVSIGDPAASYPNINTIDIDSTDSIYVGGGFSNITVNGSGSYSSLLKLNSDGSVATFNLGNGFKSMGGTSNGTITKMTISDNNRITVLGYFDQFNNQSANYIARLNSNGSIDAEFITGTGFQQSPNNIKSTSDGKVIVLSESSSNFYKGNYVGNMVVLLNSGSPDPDFSPAQLGESIGFNARPYDACFSLDGNLFVTGQFSSYGGDSTPGVAMIQYKEPSSIYTVINFTYNGEVYIGSFTPASN